MSQNTLECENAIIGALLTNSSRITEIDLFAEHFENAQLSAVYGCITGMISRGDLPDLFTVSDELSRSSKYDWLNYLATITKNTMGATNLKAYSDHVKRYSVERNAKVIANDMLMSIESEGMDSVDSAIQKLMGLGRLTKKTAYTLKESLKIAVDYVDTRFNNQGKLSGITTGFDEFDEMTGGFHDTDLIIIGARPAMGKTAILLNMMIANDVANGFVSAEMSVLQGALRMMSIAGKVDSGKLRSGKLDDDDWVNVTTSIALLNEKRIFIDDQSSPTIAEVQRQARIWRHEHGIKALWCDYVQRFRASDNRAPKHERVEEIVMGLKSLAKELDFPVIGLCQVGRKVDDRPNKRPTMSDLSDSSAIEKEADLVAMLYRDEVYNPDSESKGIAELNIEKSRHGPTGGVKLNWKGKHMIFSDPVTGYGGY
jgi:replicative DNA helicase